MKDDVLRRLNGFARSFSEFSAGQKAVALVGTAALLLAGFMVFRWVSQPDYSPLFTNLSAKDASAVVDQLDSKGVDYQITNGGSTVMVPKNDVYATRISLSGEGLPSESSSGYGQLDGQSLSTSQFKEQTDFKRAMEGELQNTIKGIDGVDSAVVHLALPAKQVFADKQDPPTASVLVGTRAGTTLTAEQVQAIVHLVASSIDGMSAEKVTVADSTGKLLSSSDVNGGAAASATSKYQSDYEKQVDSDLQGMLDRVLGPGNSQVQTTATLDFDKATTESKVYRAPNPPGLTLSRQSDSEVYKGAAAGAASNGVVGPDGQMDTTAGTTANGGNGSEYTKKSATEDNAVDTTVERRQKAPGSLQQLHVAVAIDGRAAASSDPVEIEQMIRSAVGIQPKRGDTVRVSVLPFDRTAEKAAASELAAQKAAAAKAARMQMFRNIAIGVLLLLALVLAWLRSRKRSKQRADATTYVVEQLRTESARRDDDAALRAAPADMLSLEGSRTPEDDIREELAALVERQPEDVATLLRGWLVER